MRDFLKTLKYEAITHGLLGIGPVTSTMLCGCALATAAFTMGAHWLGSGVLGLPLGVWLVAGAAVGARELSGRARRQASPTSLASAQTENLGPVQRVLDFAAIPARRATSAKRELDRLSDRLRWSVGRGAESIRIGFDLNESDAQALLHAASLSAERSGGLEVSGVPIVLVRALSGLVNAGPNDARQFDALLRRGTDDRLHLFVHESEGAPAAWFDWSKPLPLGFPGTFPSRVDCAQASLGVSALSDRRSAELILRLTIAAAVLGRTGPRAAGGVAGLASALGATALGPSIPSAAPRRALAAGSIVVERAMTDLGDALVAVDPGLGGNGRGAVEAAARVVSAYFSQHHSELISASRSSLCAAAAAALPGEAEITLRLAAAEISAGNTNDAKLALIRGFRQLRAHDARAHVDPLSFVLAEAQLGSGDRLTLGRMCAGVCLGWGTSPAETIDYVRDDLLEDLRLAGWLETREVDAAMLRDMIIAMEGEMLAGGSNTPGSLRRAA